MTFYYDPVIDHHQLQGPEGGLGPSLYLGPQRHDAARLLFEGAAARLGWHEPGEVREPPGNPRGSILGLWLAREYGDAAAYAKLRRHVEARHEPTWDRRRGEFAWGYGLGEPHPRGQWNATAAAAEAGGPKAWWRLFNEPNLRKLVEPTVVGVDFPTVAVRQAFWDAAARTLVVATAPVNEAVRGRPTSFRVTNVADPAGWSVLADGRPYAGWRVAGADVEVATTVDHHAFVLRHVGPGAPGAAAGR